MRTRFWIAAVIYPMVNAVLFGAGAVPLLAVPALSEHAGMLMPLVVAASFVIAVPLSWIVAPRLRARFWRQRQQTA